MNKLLLILGIVCTVIAAGSGLIMGTIHISSALRSSLGNTFTVTGKAAVVHGNSNKYLVFTDVTTYEVGDSYIHGRFDSSDVYGKIKVGATYTSTLQGRRIPIFSMYQNIIEPVEVVKAQGRSDIP